MRSILAIGLNTFREAIRSHVLHVIGLLALIFFALAHFLASVSVGQNLKIVTDLGLAGISFFSVLVAIFVGMRIVSEELERRTVYTILTKPVHRYQFIVGKYVGLSLTLGTIVLALAAVLIATIWLMGGELTHVHLIAIALVYVEVLVVNAVAVFCSAITSPLLAAMLTFAFYLIGKTLGNLLDLLKFLKDPTLGTLLTSLYHLLPNLDAFNLTKEVVYDIPLQWPTIGISVIYAAIWITLLLSAASFILARRDL